MVDGSVADFIDTIVIQRDKNVICVFNTQEFPSSWNNDHINYVVQYMEYLASWALKKNSIQKKVSFGQNQVFVN